MNNILLFFKLIRWKNLLIIALGQFLVKLYLDRFLSNPIFSTNLFIVLVLSTILIAAGGYIINDINDLRVDAINKPKRVLINTFITEKTATNLFLAFNITGLLMGYFLALKIGNRNLFTLFLFSSALLYFYNITLKKLFLIGNLAIALLVGLSLMLVAIFQLYQVYQIDGIDLTIINTVFKTVLYYALFASILNFIREIVKDIEDHDGDKQMGFSTMAIVLGKKTSKIIVLVLLFILIIAISYLLYAYLSEAKRVLYYGFGLIIILIYTFFQIIESDSNTIKHSSNLLKVIMFYGLFALLLM